MKIQDILIKYITVLTVKVEKKLIFINWSEFFGQLFYIARIII